MRGSQDAQDVGVCVLMASGGMAPSNEKLERNVDPTLHPGLRLAFKRQVSYMHGMPRT